MGLALGLELWQSALLATACNLLVIPTAYLFLEFFHKLFYRMQWYKNLFDALVSRTREKIRKYTDRFGPAGLFLFVAIPLPMTGAWTGVLGAWLLALPKRKIVPALCLGVLTAGIIVSIVIGLGLEGFSIFIKNAKN